MKTAGRRVLLAWELGGNLGHLSRLMAIARMVEDAGGTPVWALPAHAVDSPWLAEIEHPRLQTPDSVEPGERLAVLSFASILLNVGFSRPDGIARAIGQWRALLKEVRPDLIVLDTAPVAQLVACLDGWPALVVSNGFDSPPATCPTFGIGLRGPFAERLNAGHLQRFASSLDAAARLSGVPTAPSLHHYFYYPTRYLDCVAETDPYGARDDVVYTGPLIGLPRLDSPRWLREPGRCSLNVFAYLQTAPTQQAVLRALSDLDANTLCITDDRGASNLALPGTRVLTSPVQLDAAIRHADLVVGYGSLGLMTAARMAGKPQLAVPTEVDKTVLAQRMARDGSAVLLAEGGDVEAAVDAALRLRLGAVTADPTANARLRAQLGGEA